MSDWLPLCPLKRNKRLIYPICFPFCRYYYDDAVVVDKFILEKPSDRDILTRIVSYMLVSHRNYSNAFKYDCPIKTDWIRTIYRFRRLIKKLFGSTILPSSATSKRDEISRIKDVGGWMAEGTISQVGGDNRFKCWRSSSGELLFYRVAIHM